MAIKIKYPLLLQLMLCTWLMPSCQQDTTVTQVEVNNFCIEEYDFDCITLGLEGCKLIVQCDDNTTKTSKSAKKKKKKKKSTAKEEDYFKKHVGFFLQLMQSGKIAEAAKYSTEYGLKSFLNFNIDKIEDFTIRQVSSDDVLGTAMVKINRLPEKMFYFNMHDNRWTFVGTDDDWRS